MSNPLEVRFVTNRGDRSVASQKDESRDVMSLPIMNKEIR